MVDVSSWNVLVVDDEPDNIGVVEHILRFYKARVRTAGSAGEGLAQMHEEVPTILLVDIQMPGMSGSELLKLVREREAWRMVKVIAVTAHAMQGDRERFLSTGFDGYISKPISAFTLINDIGECLGTQDQ